MYPDPRGAAPARPAQRAHLWSRGRRLDARTALPLEPLELLEHAAAAG